MTLIIIGLILMLVGFAGVILPFLPGVPLTWLGLLLYAWGMHFELISGTTIVIFLVLTIASMVMEFLLPVFGAKRYQASKYGVWGAIIGLIVGPFVFNAIGIIIGPLVGAIVAELLAGKKHQAWKSGTGVFVGFMVSIVLRVVLVLVMFGFVIASMFTWFTTS